MTELRAELLQLVQRQKQLNQLIAGLRNHFYACVVSPSIDRAKAKNAQERFQYERELDNVKSRIKEVQRLLTERRGAEALERAYKKGRADAAGEPFLEENNNDDPIQKGKEYMEKVKAECEKERDEALECIETEKRALWKRLNELREKEEAVKWTHHDQIEKAKEEAITQFGYYVERD
jgi:hypothetical protein